MALLEVDGVTIQFGGVRALDKVNLKVEQGEIRGLLGPNGAGKTTLFNIISGMLRPSDGSVVFRGRNITNLPPAARCHEGIARTFQIVQPFSRLSVVENVAAAYIFGTLRKGRRPSRQQAVEKAHDFLAFGKLDTKAHHSAASLTLSERKRLEMVRALATSPALLLLDEVLAGLNQREADDMAEIIRQAQRQFGLAILIIEHNMEAITALSDRISVLNFGTLIADGDAKSVIADESMVKAYVGERSAFQVSRPSRATVAESAMPMLDVKGLSTGYGDLRVVRGVNFSVAQGEVIALIGSNGAGKSTTLKALAGLIDIHAGTIKFNGASLNNEPAYERIRRGISLVPEGRRLFMNMTVRENLEMGGAVVPPPQGTAREIERVFTLFPILADKQTKHANTLSGGQQQMLAIGMGLISRPKLLVLDEPSLGLAPIMVGHLYDAIANLKREGLTILLVEQHVFLALNVADRAYVMENGHIVLEGSSEHLMANAHIQEHYFGAASRGNPQKSEAGRSQSALGYDA